MFKIKLLKTTILSLIILLISLNSFSQKALSEDCIGAIPVCQDIYIEQTPYLYSGEGAYPNEIYFDNNNDCYTKETNGVWYVFTAQTSGLIKFSIKPDDMVDDFDWTMIDITNISCADIFNRTDKYISSNTYGDPIFNGYTGANSDSLSSGNCNGPGTEFGPRFNVDVPIDKNDTYVLYISNWSESTHGYTLDFSPSTAQIYDNEAPYITFAPGFTPKCNLTQINISFNEYVKCSGVLPSFFSLSNGINIVDIISTQCDNGNNTGKNFSLVLDKPLTPGNYTLSINSNITDNCGNVAPPQTFAFTLNEPNILDTDLALDCITGNYSLTITPNGGVSNFTYSAINSGITSNYNSNVLNNLPNGNYDLFITNKITSCKSNLTNIQLQPYFPIQANVSSTDILCFGDDDGTLNINATGGSGTLLYSIDNGNNFSIFHNFSNLDGGNYSIQIKDDFNCIKTLNTTIDEPDKILIDKDITQINCHGDSNGEINLTVQGGTSPYEIIWNTGSTSQSLTNLTIGNYKAIITDSNNCKDSVSIDIVEPEILSTNAIIQEVKCYGDFTGDIEVKVTGGVQPYNYQWNNGNTTGTLHNLQSGNYQVLVTDFNNCQKILNITINQPEPILVTNQLNNIKCNGNFDGKIDLTVIGGIEPYKYAWNNGETTQDIYSLQSGNYNVLITDFNNCQKNLNFELTQPDILETNFISENIKCNGDLTGIINLNVIGGTQPYNFLWNTGQTIQNLQNISAGSYNVTISDLNNCLNELSFELTQPEPLITNHNSENITCNGGFNGKIDLTVIGGIQPYNYEWNNGESTEDLNNLYAGIYNLIITDFNNCKKTFEIELTQPLDFVAHLTKNNISCYGYNDGSLILSLIGGSPPYKYLWNTGDTVQNIDNLSIGYYMITIIDQTVDKCAISEAILTQPDSLYLDFVPVNISCNKGEDGQISGNILGGTPNYNILIIDEFGNNFYDFTGLHKGDFLIEITDNNNCYFETNTSINEPEPFEVETNITNSCLPEGNGSIELLVSGATPPYNFLWNNGDDSQSTYNLTPNIYSLLLKDKNNCILNLKFSVEEDICPPYVELFNIFTPNNDQENDIFFINTQFVESYNAIIYNRWGDKIYEWNEKTEGWNGKNPKTNNELPDGVYFCRIKAIGINGDIIEKSGSFSLYR